MLGGWGRGTGTQQCVCPPPLHLMCTPGWGAGVRPRGDSSVGGGGMKGAVVQTGGKPCMSPPVGTHFALLFPRRGSRGQPAPTGRR